MNSVHLHHNSAVLPGFYMEKKKILKKKKNHP